MLVLLHLTPGSLARRLQFFAIHLNRLRTRRRSDCAQIIWAQSLPMGTSHAVSRKKQNTQWQVPADTILWGSGWLTFDKVFPVIFHPVAIAVCHLVGKSVTNRSLTKD